METETTTAGVAIADAAALALALKTIKPAVAVKATLPILGHVHIVTTGDDRLALAATNLDLALTATIDALTDGPMDLCLPYAALVRLIDPERSGDVTIGLEVAPEDGADYNPRANSRVGKTAVTQGKRVARVDTLSGVDFPTLATKEHATGPELTLSAAQWARVRAGVLTAAAADDSRPVLAGVYVSSDGGHATLAAADGFRLGLYDAGACEPFAGMLIPAHNLAAIPPKVDVTIHGASEHRSQVFFSYRVATKAAVVEVAGLSRLIDGHFPDVRHIIPRDTPHSYRVEVSAISDAVKLKPGNDVLKFGPAAVVANVEGVGEITWNGTTVTYAGATDEAAPWFALNARYADWAADACGDGKYVTFRGSLPGAPWLAERDGLLVLVMPMTINS